jgi:ketosteroid isomerase-like protein
MARKIVLNRKMRRLLMKFSLLILGVLLLPAGSLIAQTPAPPGAAANVRENASPEARQEVIAAVEQWKQAALSKSRSGLEAVLHDDLSYGHTTGEVLNKAQTLERGLAAQQSFTAIDLGNQQVRVHGNVALVTQTIAFHVSKDGTQSVANLSGLDVWIKGHHGWQLLARQLTRLPQ